MMEIRTVRPPLRNILGKPKHLARQGPLILMMIPMFLITLVNCYLPMFGVLMAFKRINIRQGILNSPWSGFENFKFLFATDAAWRITRNTVLYNLVFIFVGMLLAVLIAIAISELRNKLVSKVHQTLIILPNFLSMVVVSYVVYSLLSFNYGYINTVIVGLFGGEPIDFYNTSGYWPYILVATRIWCTAGYGSIIYIASIAGIDREMYEAAVIDGATKLQQIMFVTIPMIRPVMVITLILSLGGIIRGDFGLFYLVPLNSAPLYGTTDVLDTYVYRALFSLNDPGMAAAAGFYQSVIGAVMVIGANFLVKKIDPEQSLF